MPDAQEEVVDRARKWVTYLRLVADSSRTVDSPRVEFAIDHARHELHAHEMERLRTAWLDVIRFHARVALGRDTFFDVGAPTLTLGEAQERVRAARGPEFTPPDGPSPGEHPGRVAYRWLVALHGCDALGRHVGHGQRAYWNAVRGRLAEFADDPTVALPSASSPARGHRGTSGVVRAAARGFAELVDQPKTRTGARGGSRTAHPRRGPSLAGPWRLAAIRRELECYLDVADWESAIGRFRGLGEDERRDPRLRVLASWAHLARDEFEAAQGVQRGLRRDSASSIDSVEPWTQAPLRLAELAVAKPEWSQLLLGSPTGPAEIEPGEGRGLPMGAGETKGHLVVLEGVPGRDQGDVDGDIGGNEDGGWAARAESGCPDLKCLRVCWSASFLGVVAFRPGIGGSLIASAGSPGLRTSAADWFEGREGSWSQKYEPECRLVVGCSTLVEHRTSGAIRGAIDPEHTRAIALIPVFDEGGEVGGWIWAEWSHHLVPARARLEGGGRAWMNRVRAELERARDQDEARLHSTSGPPDGPAYSIARTAPDPNDSTRPGDPCTETKGRPRTPAGAPSTGGVVGRPSPESRGPTEDTLDQVLRDAPFRIDPGNEGRWTFGGGDGVPVGEEGDIPRRGTRADVALGDRMALRSCAEQFHRWIEALAIKTHQRRWWGILPGPSGPVLLVQGGGALRPRRDAWGQGRALRRSWASGEAVAFDEPDAQLSIHPQAGSGVVLPVKARGRVVALLALESTRRRDFRPRDVERMTVQLEALAPGFHIARFSDWHEARFRDPIYFAEGTGGLASRVADVFAAGQSRGPIVLRGEAGVGRHTVARWLHFESEDREGPCIRVSCKRLSPKSGAFPWTVEGWQSGPWWKRRRQTSEEYGADLASFDWRGTLVLDHFESLTAEVRDELEEWLDAWSKLPAGDPTLKKAPRVVVLTRLDCDGPAGTGWSAREWSGSTSTESTDGRSRPNSEVADLGTPLQRFRIDVPRLRDRREEIPTLAGLLARRYAAEEGLPRMRFHGEALATLWRQGWEGNLPELGSLVYKLVLLHPGREIGAGEVADVARRFGLTLVTRIPSKAPRRADVIAALESTRTGRGTLNKTRAALYLGWDPDTLVARMRDLGLDVATGAPLPSDGSEGAPSGNP